MQLSLTVRGPGAEAVSYLLAKNPNNLFERGEKGLTVRLVYTMFSKEEVQFLIYVKTDPIELVIYGIDYLQPENLVRLKQRNAGKKQRNALKEFALGVEAVNRFVRRESIERYHEWL
ncbi:hypothetical protein AA0X95_13935 [Bacillus sp. 1P10SD]|uniref:hypothetical protein n=1 Tax=Bacillus sp. 1P10SD TaxID=3132265 RepID=UPI0039A59344